MVIRVKWEGISQSHLFLKSEETLGNFCEDSHFSAKFRLDAFWV
jgi:hypothetical protein